MMKQIASIMDKNFLKVKALDCVSFIKDLALEKRIDYFPVVENNITIGVVTYKELIQAHPNRIAADAMTHSFMVINSDMSIWEAKSIFEEEAIELFIVEEDRKIVGLVTSSVLDIEFGKHFDLLTGLHKTDYVYYHALELIKKESEISIIFIDVNNFGQIDKKHGHIYGDNILKEIAYLLNKHKPKGTYLCRFGGDEFVVLTPFHADKAAKIAEELLDIVATGMYCDDDIITVSAGISGGKRVSSRVTDNYKTVQNLINIASLACSEAKKNTNNLCIALGTDSMEIA